MNVDLPDPEGPVSAMNSPGCTSSLTPRSARTCISPRSYVLVRSRTEISGRTGSVTFIGLLPCDSRPTLRAAPLPPRLVGVRQGQQR